MRGKSLFLVIFMAMMWLPACFTPVSAQNIDVDSMGDEELTLLLTMILGRLREEEDLSPEAPALIATIVPLIEPESETKPLKQTVYANKKLVIDKLPNSMFVQNRQPEAEKGVSPEDVTINVTELIGTQCSPDGCVWDYGDGILYCSCG